MNYVILLHDDKGNNKATIYYKYFHNSILTMENVRNLWEFIKHNKHQCVELSAIRYAEQDVDDPLITPDVMKVVENHGGIDERLYDEYDFVSKLFPNENFKTKNHPHYGLVNITPNGIDEVLDECQALVKLNVDTGDVINGCVYKFYSLDEFNEQYVDGEKITDSDIGQLYVENKKVFFDKYNAEETDNIFESFKSQEKFNHFSSDGGYTAIIG